MPYVLALTSITLTAVAQILLKLGTGSGSGAETGSFLVKMVGMLTNRYVLGGLAVYGISTLFWLAALGRLKLSVAYPMVSLSYVLVVLGAHWFLGEPVGLAQKAGLGLIIGGVLLLIR